MFPKDAFGGICNAVVLHNRILNSTRKKSGNTIAAQPILLPLNPYNCRSTHTIAAQPSDVHEYE